MVKKEISGSSGLYSRRYFHLASADITTSAEAFLRNSPLTCGLAAGSPISVPESPGEQCQAFLKAIVQPDRLYNLVGSYETGDLMFPGEVLSSKDLLDGELACSLPEFVRGGLIRFNPVGQIGSGRAGTYCDSDVTGFAYAMIESDFWPIAEQEHLIAALIEAGLPVKTVVHSGGKSLHALICIGAQSPEEFKEKRRELFDAVVPLGFDPATSNPSRMSRLPGCLRVLKDGTQARQNLIYLA